MDIETAKLLFQVLQFVITGGIGIYVYLATKNRVTNERINDLEHDLDIKIDGHGERLAHLEAHAEGAPTHDDLSRLHEKINRVAESQGRLEGTVAGIDSNVRQLLNRIVERGLK